MTQPIIHDYLTQIFVKHYKLEPAPAAEEALRFMEILGLYDMQIIVGQWVIPEPATPLSPYETMVQNFKDWESRRPWMPPELEN